MATVFIHIGAPKTATSTLQAVLARSERRLLEAGVLYPVCCRSGDAHHVLVCDLIETHHGNPMPDVWYGEFPRGQAWSTLAAEIAEHGDRLRTVVVSSELFFGQSRKLGPFLQDMRTRLAGHEVKIVAYLRRQDQLYSSFYNQDVKGARQWPGTAYQFYATHQIFQRDYLAMMKAWGEVFGEGNILLRPFEPAQWRDGDIVRDFCATTGLPELTAGVLERNESLGPNQLYIKQALNRIGFDKALNPEMVRLVLQLCPEAPAKNLMYVNRRPYMRLREEWLQTNERLARQFGGEPGFFREPIPMAKELTPFEVERGALLGYLRRLDRELAGDRLAGHRPLLARGALLVVAEQDLWDDLDPGLRARLTDWI